MGHVLWHAMAMARPVTGYQLLVHRLADHAHLHGLCDHPTPAEHAFACAPATPPPSRLTAATPRPLQAVGEPPFHLGASVFFALKDAVYAAREAAGHTGWFVLDAPATPERLRMLCADHITAPYAAPDIRPKISC